MKETLKTCSKNTEISGGASGLYKILLELLDRREQLAPMAKEYALLDKTLKRYFYGVPDFRIGQYRIQGFFYDGVKLEIPSKIKNKYLKKSQMWTVNIDKVKKIKK